MGVVLSRGEPYCWVLSRALCSEASVSLKSLCPELPSILKAWVYADNADTYLVDCRGPDKRGRRRAPNPVPWPKHAVYLEVLRKSWGVRRWGGRGRKQRGFGKARSEESGNRPKQEGRSSAMGARNCWPGPCSQNLFI